MKYLVYVFLSTVILSGCTQDNDSKVTQPVAMKGDAYIAKIGYGGPSFNNDNALLDPDGLEHAYNDGDVVTGYFLAILLFKGYGVEEDEHRSVAILLDVWERGLVDSGYNLFHVYYDGAGVAKNNDLALYYLRRSAELGYMKSQRELGFLYAGRAQGVENILPLDKHKSYYWLNEAAKNEDKLSAVNVAGYLRKGYGVNKNEEAALRLLLGSLDMPRGSNIGAYRVLGHYYETGIGTNVNLVKAYLYYDQVQPSMDKDKLRVMQIMTEEQIDKAKHLSLALQSETNTYVMPK